METGGEKDDHRREQKILPGYPEGASRAAGKRLFPGRPGSIFWIAGKILSDFFRL